MRIFVVDPSLFTLPYDSHLCNGLAGEGHQVTLYGRRLRHGERIAAPEFTFVPYFYGMSERMDPSARRLRKIRSLLKAWEHLRATLRFIKEVVRTRPDAVHYQWMPFPLVDRMAIKQFKKQGIPVFFTVHDTEPFNAAPTMKGQRAGWKDTLDLFDALFVHTEFSKLALMRLGIQETNIIVVPHGLLSFPSHGAAPDDTGRRADPATKRILFFGTIKPYKGLDVLIRAIGALHAKGHTDIRLAVIGSAQNDNPEHYRALAREFNVANAIDFDVRFFDDAELPNIFSMADLVVFPYRKIDGSGALLTALAHGMPFVASDIGMFHELFQGHPDFLVPPEDPDALAERLIKIFGNPRVLHAMQKELLQVRDHIPSWKDIGKETVEAYRHHAPFSRPIIFLESDFDTRIPGARVITSPFRRHNKFKRLLVDAGYVAALAFAPRRSVVIAPWGLFWAPGILKRIGFKRFTIISLSCDTFLSEKTRDNRTKGIIPWCKYRLASFTYPAVDSFFSCSGVVKEQLTAFGVPAKKCMLQYREWIRDAERYHHYQELSPSLEKNSFLFIGHCYAILQKRVDLLTEAFMEAKKDFPDMTLTVVGRGWKEFFGAKEARALELEGIVFTGETYDLDPFLAGAAFYVHPGELEGFGLSVVESMLAGLIPLVSTKTGAKDAAAAVDPGLLFELSRESMAAKLREAVAMPIAERRRLSEQARAVARTYQPSESIPRLREELIAQIRAL